MHVVSFSRLILLAAAVASCSSPATYDATGTFEAIETIVSADASGKLITFTVEEGQTLARGGVVGYVDSAQLYFRKLQLLRQVDATLAQRPDLTSQLAPLQIQLETAQREQARVSKLVAANAANTKQLDDANAQVDVLTRQLEATRKSLSITTAALNEQVKPLRAQLDQLNDQLAKCKITNPVDGTVLTKFAEANELTSTGKPLYKIANLSEIILRAYVTYPQLANLKLGQSLQVLADDGKGGYKSYTGSITWISSRAEFTPKTIQTKDERANLVYAVKITVVNDGLLKIGMYADVKF